MADPVQATLDLLSGAMSPVQASAHAALSGFGSFLDDAKDTLNSAASGLVQGAVASGPQVQGAIDTAQAAGNAAMAPVAQGIDTAAGAALNPVAAGTNAVNAMNAAADTGVPPAPTPEEAAAQGIISPTEAGVAETMGQVALGGPKGLAAPVAGAVDLARTAGTKAATISDALRIAADALEGKTPAAAAESAPDVTPAMGITNKEGNIELGAGPSMVPGSPFADKMGYTANQLFQPIENAPEAAKPILEDFAGSVNQAAQKGRTAQLRVADVLGPENDNLTSAANYAQTGDLVHPLDATPEQAQLSRDMESSINAAGDLGREHGYINGDIRNANDPNADQFYFPRLDAQGVPEGVGAKPGNFNPNNVYSNQRLYPSIQERMAADAADPTAPGLMDSVSVPYGQHITQTSISEAKYQLGQQLLNTPESGAFRIVDDPEKFKELQDQGVNVAMQRPDGFVSGATVDPNSHIFDGMAFDPDLGTALKNMIARSTLANQPVIGGVTQLAQAAKETMLSGVFHPVVTARQAMRIATWAAGDPAAGANAIAQGFRNAFSTTGNDAWALANAAAREDSAFNGMTIGGSAVSPDVTGAAGMPKMRAITGGVIGAASGEENARQNNRGLAAQIGEAALGGLALGAGNAVVGTAFQKALWERFIPTLKVEMYKTLTNAGQEGVASARFLNNSFGGQNLLEMARAPGFQDLLRLTVLSPDWLEGWIRNAGMASSMGGPGANMTRRYWAGTLGAGLLGMQAANMALTPDHHPTWMNAPGQQFKLDTSALLGPNSYTDVLGLGPVSSALNAGDYVGVAKGDPAAVLPDIARSHLGVLPASAIELATGNTFSGKAISPKNTPSAIAGAERVGATLSNFAPLPAQIGPNTTIPAFMLNAATGVRTSVVPPPKFPIPGVPSGRTPGAVRTVPPAPKFKLPR